MSETISRKKAREEFRAMRKLCEEKGIAFLSDCPDHPIFKSGSMIFFTGPSMKSSKGGSRKEAGRA